MTWHASVGLKRHGMTWRFLFGSPPGRFVQFVQLAHSVTKELNTVVAAPWPSVRPQQWHR